MDRGTAMPRRTWCPMENHAMGALVDGRWVREEHFPTNDGAFQRA